MHPKYHNDLSGLGKANQRSYYAATEEEHEERPEELYPVPYERPPAAPASPLGGITNFFQNLPVKEIKGFVDRMGGVEGLMNTMTKVNTFMKNVQQMSPMVKLLAGSVLSRRGSSSSGGSTSGGSRKSSSRRRSKRRSPSRSRARR